MTLASAGVLAALFIRALLASPWARQILDRPNHRSMHSTPTPRLGGLGILAAAGLVTVAVGATLPPLLWLAVAALLGLSMLDDVCDLPAGARLPLHLLIGGLAARAVAPDWPLEYILLASLTLGWAINLYNFMDGLDGLAGGQAVFGFAAYALAATWHGDSNLALSSCAIVGAALGFLMFNLPPARIFMGDAGSTTLGLLAGALGLLGAVREVWPIWLPLLAFLPFIFDASATLVARILGRQRFWEAHRQHAYQRLSLLGLGVRRTTGVYYMIMVGCTLLALTAQWVHGPSALIALSLLLLSGLYLAVQVLWRRRSLGRQTPDPRPTPSAGK